MENEHLHDLEPRECTACDRSFVAIKDGDEICQECVQALDEAEIVE